MLETAQEMKGTVISMGEGNGADYGSESACARNDYIFSKCILGSTLLKRPEKNKLSFAPVVNVLFRVTVQQL